MDATSKRLMRQAVAYDRLAAKAFKAGNLGSYEHYNKLSSHLRGQVQRMRERKNNG